MDGGGCGSFKADFAADGVARLCDRVKEKLREFMGDYTDDTLAEYVVVLLRNGRKKDEAAKELQVFLGDDNIAFVSWLWDHLSSNLHLYVQPKAATSNDEAKSSHTLRDLPVGNKSSGHNLTGDLHTNPEPEYGSMTNRTSKSKQRREWGGLLREEAQAFPLRSVLADQSHADVETNQKSHTVRRSHSPKMHHHRKRSRDEDERQTKRISSSHPVIDAPRRILQFAVRDAVRTVQQPTPRLEPASKRLCSVLSTVTSDSMQDVLLQRTNSKVRVPGAAAALRAAAEAAEDVATGRSSGSVFDRLGGRRGALDTANESLDFNDNDSEDKEYDDIGHAPATNHEDYRQRNQHGEKFFGDANMFDQENEEAADSASDNDGYDGIGVVRYRGLGASRSVLSSSKDKEALLVGRRDAQRATAIRRRLMDQDSPASSVPRTSGKIVNISVNVNTWKPPNYEAPRNAGNAEAHMALEKKDSAVGKSSVRIAHVNDVSMTDKAKGFALSGSQVESQKTLQAPVAGSYTTGQPQGDIDSRTVFVSNVHFAATKDALSRHFNKFGAVLKVIIVTDGATGQPTGSACIEFLHKESVEQALSLNGTSFMSRILKVVRRSSHEVPQMVGWPHAARGSPFGSRLIRTAYPRPVLPSAVRGRLLLKFGARSLQWKRDAAPSQPTEAAASGNLLVSPTARSFTYTRTKPNANAGPRT